MPCALTGVQVRQRFFGTVKSKRKSKLKGEVADYNIHFDDDTDAKLSHPSTPCNLLVEDVDFFCPPFSAPLPIGTLVDSRFQNKTQWFRGRVGGYSHAEGYTICYLDGDGETGVPSQAIRRIKEEGEWRPEDKREKISDFLDKCDREGKLVAWPEGGEEEEEDLSQSPKPKQRKKRARAPPSEGNAEGSSKKRTQRKVIMDDGKVFAAGSDAGAVTSYQNRLARAAAHQRLEDGLSGPGSPSFSPAASSITTIPTTSQATINSNESDVRDVSFKSDAPPDVTPFEKRGVAKEVQLSAFQSLMLGMRGSDPMEATAFLCEMLGDRALPFLSKEFQLFKAISQSTNLLLTHSLCSAGRVASASFPAHRYANGIGANFRWDEDFWPILKSATSALSSHKPLGASLENAGVALAFLATFVASDVALGELTREGARGRPAAAFFMRGTRESLKATSRQCAEAFSTLPSRVHPLEANQCLKCMMSILCSVYRVYGAGEADGAFILKDDVLRIKEKEGRNEYVAMLDMDVREELCKKLGKKVDKDDVMGRKPDPYLDFV